MFIKRSPYEQKDHPIKKNLVPMRLKNIYTSYYLSDQPELDIQKSAPPSDSMCDSLI